MARRRRVFGFNDKTAISIIGIVMALALLEYVEVFIKPIMFILAIAALYFGFRWYAKELAREKILELGIKEIDVMKGTDFENYLGVLFEKMGYKVQYTPASGDYGTDLIIRKDVRAIAVQAKRYKSTVGVSAIQEVSGARGYYSTNEAWVVTNNTFTKNACNLAERTSVKLIDRGYLINLIAKANKATPANCIDAAETRIE
ncbi:restriction endonuclease [Domibacillus aminovorans]|uniref:Restriction endonuclease type IV Mrr domain-containing protein n=1 Tax=Domibacillus aminovorans TaxID=29332 RepID=A0A177LAC5_9BACI|nr:restriction endonuclease [Domibacillus aminovorans]OAH61591.1 hypothetical protein AWH49_11610 [Domibacillus aminovorans]